MSGDGIEVLRSEIAAFYAGFGQPELLMSAFRDAVLVVPLTDDDRICLFDVRGVRWVCAFTGMEEFAAWLNRRGVVPDREYRHHTLQGWRLGEYARAQAEPTGVMIDAVGVAPMAFPPRVGDDVEIAVGVL